MPELPEVETTLRGIYPTLNKQKIKRIDVRERRMRWPVPKEVEAGLGGEIVKSLTRRGKYILIGTEKGTAMLHLGMSGSLRIVTPDVAPEKHDHIDIVLNKKIIRFNDPRRFGSLLWTTDEPGQHKLLKELGPEPLSDSFTIDYLFNASRSRHVAIKQFIMNSNIVVGVGNIYASESLYRAGINPKKAAGKISRQRYAKLVCAIKEVLAEAIEMGGTTLRDFHGSDGKPGYFRIKLKVYGHAGEPCEACSAPIKQITQGQRATYYCPACQKN